VIAVGDINLEIELQITLKGSVRELAAFMERFSSSPVVIEIAGEVRSDNEGCAETAELCERLGFGNGGRTRRKG
jgi:hypothetical protein